MKLEEGGQATPFVGEGSTGTQFYANAEGRRADGAPDPIWMPDIYPAGKYIFAGWELAAETIDSGRAKAKLAELSA